MKIFTHSTAGQRRAWKTILGLFLCHLAFVSSAQWGYTTNGGTVTITNYTGTNGSVTIPTNLSGLVVAALGPNTFAYNTRLTNVTIPGSVTMIGAGAFSHCANLTNASVAGGVLSLGDFAFFGCSALTSLALPSSVTNLGEAVFSGCARLRSVTLPTGLIALRDEMFYDCSNLPGLTLPASVTRIGNAAFGNCSKLGAVNLSANLGVIGFNAFASCASLTDLVLPASLTTIGEFAFAGCTGLTNITVPVNVGHILYTPFPSCTNLSNILVNSLNPVYTSVNGVLFDRSRANLLQFPPGRGGSYLVPESVTNIALGAFANTHLTNLTLPGSIGGIGGNAFGSSRLARVYFSGAAPATDPTAFQDNTNATVYYLAGTTGWHSSLAGRPAMPWNIAPTFPLVSTEPVGVSVEAGGNTSLQISAVGAAKLGYQWLLNGAKLANSSTVSGANTSDIVLKNVAPANAGAYQAVVTNAFGSATSLVANVTVLTAPILLAQPASQTEPTGGTAKFTVKASGIPLNFIWLFNNTPLANGGNISGAATNLLDINPVFATNAGSYSVVVSNSTASVTSKVVMLNLSVEKTKPSVAINSPKAGSRSPAPLLEGTASDTVRVLAVNYWITNLNNGVRTLLTGQAGLTAGTGAASNWTIPPPMLLPGTNILTVQSDNYSGLDSLRESRTFFQQTAAPFQVLVNPPGMGTVSIVPSVKGEASPDGGAELFVGEGYTLDAKPALHWRLTNWLVNGALAGTNTTLSFLMESNLVVTADFTTNPVVGKAAR